MASLGQNINGTFSGISSTRAYPQIVATQLSQNASTNQSQIRVTYRVQRPNTAWWIKGNYEYTPYAGGEGQEWNLGWRSQYCNFAQYGNSVETVLTYDFWVPHHHDGTGFLDVYWEGDFGPWGTHSFGGRYDLNTITRATAASTQAASSVTSTTATANGTVTDRGLPEATDNGIYWGTSSGSLSNKVSGGTGSAGAFTVSMTSLSPGTTYYYKAYSYNAGGYAYGSVVNFTTSATTPTVTTQAASSVSYDSFTGNGNITATGGASVTRRGFCYKVGTTGDPTVSDSVVYDDGTFSTGKYTKGFTGLSGSTDYRVRAYATNSVGTSYGSTVQVTTQTASAPTVSSTTTSRLTDTYARVGGDVTSGEGVISDRGIYWGTTEGTQGTKIASGVGLGVFVVIMTGLDADTTYYFKAYATNAAGTSYGDILHFTTGRDTPTLDTYALPPFKV